MIREVDLWSLGVTFFEILVADTIRDAGGEQFTTKRISRITGSELYALYSISLSFLLRPITNELTLF